MFYLSLIMINRINLILKMVNTINSLHCSKDNKDRTLGVISQKD